MRPIHHERALGWVFHNTRQVDCASKIYKNIGSTNDACQGLWSDVCACVSERGKKAALNDVRVKRLYAFLHTHNVEINWIPFGWRRWYLTFKSARISDLCVTNLSMWEKKVSSLAAINAFQLDYTFNIHSLLSASWMLWKRISEVYEVVPTVNRFMSRCLTQLTVLFPIFFTKHWNEIVSKFV